jgi:hypothetical protein
MKIIMNVKHLQAMQQVADFLHGSGAEDERPGKYHCQFDKPLYCNY